MPLPALGELPQLTALSLAWRRLVDLKPVLMLVNTRAWCVVGNRGVVGSNALLVGPLKLSSLKIGVPQVGVHQIHIRQLAVRALSCLQ